MKKTSGHIKVLNHNSNGLQKPLPKWNNKSPCLNKSKSSDNFMKFSKAGHKKQKNDRQKVHGAFPILNRQSKQEYRLQQSHKYDNIEKNKFISRGIMKDKEITMSKKQTTATSKNKNEYDLKQKRKNKVSPAKKMKKQQPETCKLFKQQLYRQRKSDKQIQLKDKQIEYQLLTPQPTSKNEHNEKIRNLSNRSWARKLDKSCQLSQSDILTQPRLIRYQKFAFRSQKYIKLNEEIKQKELNSKNMILQQRPSEKPKHRSAFKRRISKLNRQIQYYREMSSKSEKVLKTIQNIHMKQLKQFKLKKQAYIQQIQRLKQNLEEYKPNFGHIYTYKQLIPENLVPESIIIEGNDQSESIVKSQIQRQLQIQRKGNKLIQYYINYQQNAQEQNQARQSQTSQLCLSVVSKQ